MRPMGEQSAVSGQRGGTLRNVLIWTYERGTLPYDILCGLILAFIFLVPRSCFAPKTPADATSAHTAQAAAQDVSAQRTVSDASHPGN
jgi:hypothetical protein